jgi:hypothetical protein
MDPTAVEDSEDLYRSVRASGNEFTLVDGAYKISSSAFDDRDRKPSVDRSPLRPRPEECKLSPTDGVTKLTAAEVRSSCNVKIFDKKGQVTGVHQVNVIHRPIKASATEKENLAHCQIECDPAIDTDARFRRLKEALARIATKHGFVVAPT